MHLAQVGRLEEAMTAIRRAQALDPLSLIINTEIGRLLYFSRQYDAAVAQYRNRSSWIRLLHWPPPSRCDSAAKGSYEDALAEYEKAAPVGGPMPAVGRARAYALAGRRREAEEILGTPRTIEAVDLFRLLRWHCST